jgi:hypothetical protein
MKGKGIVGGVIAIVGVIIMVVGIFRVVTSNFTAADIPTIVSTGFAWILYGAIIFIAGVVVVGFRNWVALILHLAALVPYYFAIQIIIQQGQAGNTQPLAYFNPSAIAWIIGIALNILGLVMNRVKIGAARKAPEAGAGTGAGTTPQTPPRP